MPSATTLLRSIITPAPELVPELRRRQSSLGGPLLGYYNSVINDADNWQPLTCQSSEAFASSNVFAGCIPSNSIGLPMVVTCFQTPISTVSISGTTIMCSNCVKQTIYQTTPEAGTAYYNYFCANNYSALTIFRETPATSSSSSSSTSASPASTITSVASTPTPTTSATHSPSPQPAPSKTNEGWIAGPVLGAAAFVVACVAFWYLVRTRRRPKPDRYSEYVTQQSPSEIDGRSMPVEMGVR